VGEASLKHTGARPMDGADGAEGVDILYRWGYRITVKGSNGYEYCNVVAEVSSGDSIEGSRAYASAPGNTISGDSLRWPGGAYSRSQDEGNSRIFARDGYVRSAG